MTKSFATKSIYPGASALEEARKTLNAFTFYGVKVGGLSAAAAPKFVR